MYQIQPYNIITTKTVTSFVIDRIELTLFKKALITIVIYDSAKIPVDVRSIELAGSDYEQWNNDDNYVVQYVCNQLGFLLPGSSVEKPAVEEPAVKEEPVAEPVTPVEEPVAEPVAEEPVTEEPIEEPVVELVTPVEEPTN
jgi:hypothetical protein